MVEIKDAIEMAERIADYKLLENIFWNPERAAIVKIGLKEYPMLMTLRATREIAKKYGGLEELAAEVFVDNWEMAVDDFCWLVALLVNQCIDIINLHERTDVPRLTPEEIEMQLGPADMPACIEALTRCLLYGTKRHIESEEEESPKN